MTRLTSLTLVFPQNSREPGLHHGVLVPFPSVTDCLICCVSEKGTHNASTPYGCGVVQDILFFAMIIVIATTHILLLWLRPLPLLCVGVDTLSIWSLSSKEVKRTKEIFFTQEVFWPSARTEPTPALG